MKQPVVLQSVFLIFGLFYLFACGVFVSEPAPRQLIAYQVDGQLWVMNPDGTERRLFLEVDVGVGGLRWSRDGRRIAFGGWDPEGKSAIWLADSNGGNPHPVSPKFDAGISSISWLAQNMILTSVITDTGQTWDNPQAHYFLDLQTGRMQEYSQGPEDVAPMPQGDRWISWNPTSGMIILHNLDGDSKRLFPDYDFSSVGDFDVSPSGEEIVFHGRKAGEPLGADSIYRARIDSRAQPQKIFPCEPCAFPRWSPDGKWIATHDNIYQFYIVDTKTNDVRRKFKLEHPLESYEFQWSPDSRWLLVVMNYGSPGPSFFDLAKIDTQTGTVIRLTKNERIEHYPHWSVVR